MAVRSKWAITGAVVAVLIGMFVVEQRSTSRPEPSDTAPTRAIVVMPSELKAGAAFRVSYRVKDSADAARLESPASLAIKSDGAVLYALVSSIGGEAPSVDTPPVVVPDVPLVGVGPFAFTLPELDEGRYQLCGTLRFKVGARFEEEPYCRTIKVTAG